MEDLFGIGDSDDGMDDGCVKNTRGRTTMSELTKLRSEGKTVKLEYNIYGQAIGKGGKQFASKLGAISTFKLDYSAKKLTIKRASKMFKYWKTRLTSKYVEATIRLRPNELPPRIPKLYKDVITKVEWKKFVNSRLTPEWQQKRKKMQTYRKMNKCDRRMSRGGYVRAQEILQKETGKELSNIDRADLWSISRRNKKGELVGEVAEVQKNIRFYRTIFKQLQVEGKWAPEGPDDVLARALGTPEPRGCVQGVGQGVTPSFYWDTPKPTNRARQHKDHSLGMGMRDAFEEIIRRQQEQHQEEQRILEDRLCKQEQMLRAIMAQQSTSGSNIGMPSPPYVPNSPYMLDPPTRVSNPPYVPEPPSPPQPTTIVQSLLQQGPSCQLVVGNEANIVASGIVIDPGTAGTNYVTVMVIKVLKRMILVPILCPSLDILYVDQSVGTPIPWPRHLVIISEDVHQVDHDATSEGRLERPPISSTEPPPQEKQPPINRLTQWMQTPLEQIRNIVSQ
uniref:Uncharacterized protein n=1 Tax=Cannabis sativa TaxID=3483 RepID=A0A803QNP6_CANSA